MLLRLSVAVLLRWESQELFDSFYNSFLDHFQPANSREHCLVEELVSAKWRMRRLWGIETRLISTETDTMKEALDAKFDNLDTATRIALAFESKCDGSRSLATLHRHEARLLRAATKAEDKLERILERREKKNCRNEPDTGGDAGASHVDD